MAEITIPVYSEQQLSPRAVEVIRAVVDDAYPEHNIKFKKWQAGHKKVLVFGNGPETHLWRNVDIVYTYSIAQIMSKANAASVLKSALRQFVEEPDPIPFSYPKRVSAEHVADLGMFDYDAPIAIDIETSGNLGNPDTPEDIGIISVAFYQPGHEPMVVTGSTFFTDRVLDLSDAQISILRDLLPKFKKVIYHNGKFDIRVMNRVFDIKLHNWFDTMLAHHVLNIAAGDHKLKTAARRYVGAPEWEADLKKYTVGGGYYEKIPVNLLVEYNGWDVYWTYKLWEFFAPQIDASEGDTNAFMLEMAAAQFLLYVEDYGIPMDLEYLDTYGEKLGQGLAQPLAELREITGNNTFNPGSWQQVKKWCNIERDLGITSTDDETMQEIISRYDIGTVENLFAKTLLEYRKLKKTLGTYVIGWKDRSRNRRVHPTFLVHGTSTGRLSSTNPNSQNVPRDKTIRKIVRTNG